MFKLDEIFKKKEETKIEYEVNFANPIKRVFAEIIDILIFSAVVYLFWNITIGSNIRKAINSYTSNEINIEINENTDKDNDKKVDDEIIEEITNEFTENGNIDNFEKQKIKIKKTPKIPTQKEQEQIIYQVLSKNKDDLQTFSIMSILFLLSYNIVFLMMKKQATIGQQIFNLKVIKRNGKRLDFFSILNRTLIAMMGFPSFIPFSFILPVMISKENAALYDFVSGTRVIEITNKVQK